MHATIHLSSAPQKSTQLPAWIIFASTLAVIPAYNYLLEQGSLPETITMADSTFLGFKIINAIISFYCAFTLLTGRTLYQLIKDKVYAQQNTPLTAAMPGRQGHPALKAKAQTGKSLLFHNGELSLVHSEAIPSILDGAGPGAAAPKISLKKKSKSNPALALQASEQRKESVAAGV